MQERFGDHQIILLVSKLLCLVPSFLCDDSTLNLDEMLEFYRDDLPNSAVVGTEISRWKLKWLDQSNLPCRVDFQLLTAIYERTLQRTAWILANNIKFHDGKIGQTCTN